MKCNATYKKKKKTYTCDAELHPHQLFCHVCGEPTSALKTDLSAKENLKISWKEHKEKYSETFSIGLFLTLAVYLPLIIISAIFWHNYWLTNLIMLFYVPLALIPFAMKDDYSVGNYFKSLKFYPQYWFFVLIAITYLFLLKVICTGFLLDIMVDPVLHIVRLIMVLYGVSCAYAAPFLIAEKMNPIKAIISSIKAGHETRWQLFFITVKITVINAIGALLLGIGLLYTLPFTYKTMRRYYIKMVEFELFKSPNPTLR